MISIFTGKVMETKWQLGHRIYFGDETEWRLNDQHIGVGYPLGWASFNAKQYNRIISRDEIHSGDYDFILSAGSIFNINGEMIVVDDVIYNSDNSITYHTNKIIRNDILITKEEAEKLG